ncbi:protein RDM16 [Phalaenopsis equestris]|uniref:protein RDM16 n=1 Tax=Phalaenopsis equestris TaxID=78828 RepID=UPI0009E43BBF|nr:protein RDM16 [Phalaenopsis equestris]
MASSVAGKSGSLSRDALAKAKKALQIQKQLSEKLKKLPVLNKQSSAGYVDSLHAESLKPSGAASRHGASFSSSASTSMPIQMPSAPNVSVGSAPSGNALNAGREGNAPLLATAASYEAVKRAQELAARMGFRQDPDFAPLINMFPGSAVTDAGLLPKSTKVPVLRLDAQGREIDEHGNVINKPKATNLSTLKVNINKQKKEAFQILRPELDAVPEQNAHFDTGIGINKEKLLRPKRASFQFVEEGKWSKQAEVMKIKNQFGEAQAKELKVKQSQLAKAKAEPDDNPNLIAIGERTFKEKKKDEIPELEWWDKSYLPSGTYQDISEDNLNLEKITIYVEHPRPIEPPAEPAPPPPQPLKLTKKEQKKLRTQRRLAKERDRQEMIRQGLIEPPKPKIKMSNLMKVLSSEATQDPTKMEKEVRAAALEREQAHMDRNIARKLTPQERREKKERKLFEDPSMLETFVSVYRIDDLSHPQTRFKVDVNAQENRLTGCLVISDGLSVVVVEGVRKSIKRYGKLMLKRINWAAAVADDENGDEDKAARLNKCVLVWQGSTAKPNFNRFLLHQCRSDAAARKVFADAGVPHYWDLAVNFSDELS